MVRWFHWETGTIIQPPSIGITRETRDSLQSMGTIVISGAIKLQVAIKGVEAFAVEDVTRFTRCQGRVISIRYTLCLADASLTRIAYAHISVQRLDSNPKQVERNLYQFTNNLVASVCLPFFGRLLKKRIRRDLFLVLLHVIPSPNIKYTPNETQFSQNWMIGT